jgi:formylglycine-generating enzyme required for sulfatase activity
MVGKCYSWILDHKEVGLMASIRLLQFRLLAVLGRFFDDYRAFLVTLMNRHFCPDLFWPMVFLHHADSYDPQQHRFSLNPLQFQAYGATSVPDLAGFWNHYWDLSLALNTEKAFPLLLHLMLVKKSYDFSSITVTIPDDLFVCFASLEMFFCSYYRLIHGYSTPEELTRQENLKTLFEPVFYLNNEEYRGKSFYSISIPNPDHFNIGAAENLDLWNKCPATGMEFVWIAGGEFQMGDTFKEGHSSEQPVHKVCLDGYFLGRYEVTQGQWQQVMNANPSRFKNGDRYPVETVSWYDIQEFIKILQLLSGRRYGLPTEAQWEYAAREGGRKVRFGHGQDTIDPTQANFDGRKQGVMPFLLVGEYRMSTTPVGHFPPNALGVYDMAGNVWEWCADVWDDNAYKKHARQNPVSTSGSSSRVLRGGSWYDYPGLCRSANRDWNDPSNRSGYFGFRLVLLSGQALVSSADPGVISRQSGAG